MFGGVTCGMINFPNNGCIECLHLHTPDHLNLNKDDITYKTLENFVVGVIASRNVQTILPRHYKPTDSKEQDTF